MGHQNLTPRSLERILSLSLYILLLDNLIYNVLTESYIVER